MITHLVNTARIKFVQKDWYIVSYGKLISLFRWPYIGLFHQIMEPTTGCVWR